MRRGLLVAALLLPIIGLVANIWSNAASLSDASQWRIPVAGYDPLDPIRGRYIRFQYDWTIAGDVKPCTAKGCKLCIEENMDEVSVRLADDMPGCVHLIDTGASHIHVSPRPTGTRGGYAFSSRIFIPEARAGELEEMLRTQPMVVAARLTQGGRLVNDRLEPVNIGD